MTHLPMDGDAYRVLATPFPQNQEKQAVEYCKEFRILDLSKGKSVCGPQEPFFTTLTSSHVGHYYLSHTTDSFEHTTSG